MVVLEYKDVEEKYRNKLDSMFGKKDCLVEVHPGKVLLPPYIKDVGERIQNLKVYKDDVWLSSYPRTGSTWTQEMVWCLGNNMDFNKAKTVMNLERTPLLELSVLLSNEEGDWKDNIKDTISMVENLTSPRFIKTHLPWCLLPKEIYSVKPKIIYVARNPKDMCVSYYHFLKLVHNMEGSFTDFCELMLAGKVPIGLIWDHIRGYWERRNDPNILFVKYEDMKKNHREIILKTAEFLGVSYSDDKITQLLDHLSFKGMRENNTLNLDPILQVKNGPGFVYKDDVRFIRKGQIGDWKNYMDDEMAGRFDRWTEENLRGSGLSFESSVV
uniref:Sulfotransferase domain-containing protein n=1 Tax=Clastoptera arizonana TaxID=38151 RepID=A0A1B6DEM3_9HEMI